MTLQFKFRQLTVSNFYMVIKKFILQP